MLRLSPPLPKIKAGPSHSTGGNAVLSSLARGAVSRTAPLEVTQALSTRRSPEGRCLTARRRRCWSASPLLASAGGDVGTTTQILSDGGDGGSSGLTSVAPGEMRRVYDTWRWREHNINFRVEGVQCICVYVFLCLRVLCDSRVGFSLCRYTTGLMEVYGQGGITCM